MSTAMKQFGILTAWKSKPNGRSLRAFSGPATSIEPKTTGARALPKRGSRPFGNSRFLVLAGTASVNPDFRDLLAEFNAQRADFLVVGAHALAAYGKVRATKDLDVWVRPSLDNAARVLAGLREFGAPLYDLTVQDLVTPGVVFQIGVEPVRIDVLTAIDGVDFDEAWQERFVTRFGDQPVAVLSRNHLIRNKRACGRTQDLADIEWLERHSY